MRAETHGFLGDIGTIREADDFLCDRR